MTGSKKIDELRGDKERFVAFSFAAADLLIELDKQGKICFVSGAAKGITGKNIEDLIGKTFTDILDPIDRRVIAYLLDNMSEGERISPVAARMQNTNISAVVGACSLPRAHGHLYLTINTTGLPAAQSLSVHRDDKTGLLDKNDFAKLANDQLSIAADTGQDLELTLLKLSNIQGMTDHVSEKGMDDFMSKMGSVLRSYSYGGDSAGRIDDDKYGVVHGKSFDSKALQEKVEKLSKEISPDSSIKVAPSTVDLNKGNLSQENASHALMFVINNYVSNDEESFSMSNLADGLQGRMESIMNRISSLKGVFKKHEFNLVYQPIVHLKDEGVHHYEALCRFIEGESPYETVTFAEEVGIILDLDLAVCQKAIEYLKTFRLKGDETPNVAINISGHSLESDIFVGSLHKLLETNIDIRHHIGLEVTETSQVKDLVRADRILQLFRNSGNPISLDDMGAGAASFQYIRELKIDYVKIDGSYVRDVLRNERDQAILKCMSQLCQDLKIGTIAEMVETNEQKKLLQRLGVNYGQGWLFSKPHPEIDSPKIKKRAAFNAIRKGFKTGWE